MRNQEILLLVFSSMVAAHALESRRDLELGPVPPPTPVFFARPLLAELPPNLLLSPPLVLGNAVALRLSLRLAVVEAVMHAIQQLTEALMITDFA